MVRRASAALVVAVAVLASTPAWARLWRVGVAPEDRAIRKSFIVIASGDTEGNVTFEAVPHGELEVRQQGLAALYSAAQKRYAADKQAAQDKGEKFAGRSPEKPFVKRCGDETYYSLPAAQKVAAECQKNWDKELAKKSDKGGDSKAPADKAGGPAKEQK